MLIKFCVGIAGHKTAVEGRLKKQCRPSMTSEYTAII